MYKRVRYKVLLSVIVLLLIKSCAYKPMKTPYPKPVESKEHGYVTEGYSSDKKEYWLAFSDRDSNITQTSRYSKVKPNATLGFLEPLYIVKKSALWKKYKVVRYAESFDSLKPRKEVSLGWVDKDKLVLSDKARRTNINRYFYRGIVTIGGEDVLLNSEKYIANDSAIVFHNEKNNIAESSKVAIASTVYIYKSSKDGKRLFVGTSPQIHMNNKEKPTFGWISKNMVTVLNGPQYLHYQEQKNQGNIQSGDIKIMSNKLQESKNVFITGDLQPFKKLSDLESVGNKESKVLMPYKKIDGGYKIGFFGNPFNYNLNYILNVNGEKIRYEDFEKFSSERKKLNIIFLIDESKSNDNYLNSMKSVLVDLGRKIKENIEQDFTSIKYASIMYSAVDCEESLATFELNSNYNEMYEFYEEQIKKDRCSSNKSKDIESALWKACEMLEGLEHQNNLIVLIGSNGGRSSNVPDKLIDKLGEINSKILAYQTHSKRLNSYINYVLLTEDLISKTSNIVANNSRDFLVNQERVKSKISFDLTKSKDGVFILDYPDNSMVQGGTIYPRKGEVNDYSKLIVSFFNVLKQINYENDKTYSEALSDFINFGLAKTMIKSKYELFYPNAPQFLPVEFTSQMLKEQNNQMFTGFIEDSLVNDNPDIQRVILLNKAEFDKMFNFYSAISEKIDTDNFNQYSAINDFWGIVKEYYPFLDRSNVLSIYKNTMSEILYQTTGFYNDSPLMTEVTADCWRTAHCFEKELARKYFKSISLIYTRLKKDKASIYKEIEKEGTYIFNEDYMPKIDSDIK